MTVAPLIGVPCTGTQFFSSVSIGADENVIVSPNASGHTVLVTKALALAGSTGSWTSQLDLTNNDLDIGGSLATVTNQIQQACNNGTWTGQGITSSAAAADSTHLTALGVIQNNQSGTALFTGNNPFDGTVPGIADSLVKYTYVGDANLDGKVDGSDYGLIDNGYLKHLISWFNGDFNYDSIVNGSDYTLIDNAFNTQGASLAAQVAPVAAASARVQTVLSRVAPFSGVQLENAQDASDIRRRSVAGKIFALTTDEIM